MQRHESACYAQHLQQRNAVEPLVAKHYCDKLPCHQCQSQHHREGDKCRETQHLTENTLLPLLVARNINEHRLHNLPHRAAHKGVGLSVPFVGLREVTHLSDREKTPKDEGEHLSAQGVDDIGEINYSSKASFYKNDDGILEIKIEDN